MKKLVFGSLLGLLAFSLSSARAQVVLPLPGNPYTRPLTGNPYYYLGNPGAIGPYGGVYGGYPGYPQGTTPGFFGGVNTGTTSTAAAPVNLGSPTMTGHPTRFFSYSRYFFNQGGGVRVAGTLPNIGNPNQLITGGIGNQPPRGRTNTLTGR